MTRQNRFPLYAIHNKAQVVAGVHNGNEVHGPLHAFMY